MFPTPSPDLAEQSYLAVERIGIASVLAILVLVAAIAGLFVVIAPLVRGMNKRIEEEAEDRKGEREDRKAERELRAKQLDTHKELSGVIAANTKVLEASQQVQHEQVDTLKVYTLTVNKSTEAIVAKVENIHGIAVTNGEKLDKHGERLDKIAGLLLSVNQQLAELLREIDSDKVPPVIASTTNGAVVPLENINPS